MSKLTTSVLVALALLSTSIRIEAQTRVLKVGGAAPSFPDIQSAINASLDGDLLLIRSGTYAGFNLSNRSLSILAAQGASVSVAGQINITNLAIGKLAVLGSIACQTQGIPSSSALVAQNNQGAILLRNSIFRSVNGQWGIGRAAVSLTDCDIVITHRCVNTGGDGMGGYAPPGGAGLFALRANVALFQTNCLGGLGGDEPLWYYGLPGGNGGAGCECPEGFLFAAGGQLVGGMGGDGGDENWDPLSTPVYTPCGNGGRGGDGVKLGSVPAPIVPPEIENLAATAVGNVGGGSCGNPGPSGTPYQILSGSVGTVSGTTREITVAKLAYESSSITVTATGAPGETVYLTIGPRATFAFDAALGGTKLVLSRGLNSAVVLGVVPASGGLAAQLLTNALPAIDETRTYLLQATFVAPSGAMRLSNVTSISLVDPAVSLN